jgi:hypothetical protein
MWHSMIICAVAILIGVVSPQERQIASTGPDQFVIGRHTFFDFGPPNDYYELLIVSPNVNGASIERITLTPAGDACLLPAKVEITSASIAASPATLFGTSNPCAIPEKELRRELKRCKNCLVFSGANIAMQVQCGTQTRILRSDILDKDMFDPNSNTPKHTSWTMQLLARLDQALGPGVMEKPMFPVSEDQKAPVHEALSPTLRDVSLGKYDALFKDAPNKLSDLYRAAQIHPAAPSVHLQNSAPFQPTTSMLPEYPAIARAAHVEGAVSFKIEVDGNGGVRDIAFDSGPPLLRGAVKNAVSSWKFSEEAFNEQIRATIDFALNCTTQRPSP